MPEKSVKVAEKEKLSWKVNKKVREYGIGEVWVVQKDISKRANKLKKWEKRQSSRRRSEMTCID